MYSEIEYIDPNYRQNLRISRPGYPRGYTGAAPTTISDAEYTARSSLPAALSHHRQRLLKVGDQVLLVFRADG